MSPRDASLAHSAYVVNWGSDGKIHTAIFFDLDLAEAFQANVAARFGIEIAPWISLANVTVDLK